VRRARLATLALLLVGVLLPAGGCGWASGRQSDDTGRVRVFASTDVWASVVRDVGGEFVDVTAAIDRPSQDPHDYEATARDKLAVTKADLVVYNGGGYDDWAAQLTGSDSGDRQVIDAVKVAQVEPVGGAVNEHVFYDFAAVAKVAVAVSHALAADDPEHRAEFDSRAKALTSDVSELTHRAKTIGLEHSGLTALAAEPVSGYLLQSIGIRDVTPTGFVEQSESDAGPSARARKDALDTISSGHVDMLVLNAQTEDPVSRELETAATTAHIPVVNVSETLPEGVTTYRAFADVALSAFAAAANAR
jgi:zinc/manganese transport system substrate-binding protein